ncbi:hypothetical protein LTR51_005908 [Lithohypha guttulata]|nr:hypothetical protein LTR51_005908 [Lithohypha guttulata]
MQVPTEPREIHVVAVAGQIVEGLKFLQPHNLVFGGLKSSNVHIDSEGHIKLDPELVRRPHVNSLYRRDVQSLGDMVMRWIKKAETGSAALLDFISLTSWATASELAQGSWPAFRISGRLLTSSSRRSWLKDGDRAISFHWLHRLGSPLPAQFRSPPSLGQPALRPEVRDKVKEQNLTLDLKKKRCRQNGVAIVDSESHMICHFQL